MVLNNGLDKMKDFITENSIVGTCAGVCIGLAAKDSINSLVQDIIIPLIILLLYALNITWISKYLPNKNYKLNILNFIRNLVTFFIVIIVSFLFVYFAFIYLLGIDSKVKQTI